MQSDEKYIKKSVKEIFYLSSLLLDYCKHNSDSHEANCLCAGLNVLYKKADDLNFKLMGVE